jgi:hypothetical protein
MSRERRIHPRTDARLDALLRSGDAAVDGVVENVGAGGLFFATENLESAIEDGAACVIEFSTASVEIKQVGTVLRSERYFDGAKVIRAFAIKFDAQLDVASLGI